MHGSTLTLGSPGAPRGDRRSPAPQSASPPHSSDLPSQTYPSGQVRTWPLDQDKTIPQNYSFDGCRNGAFRLSYPLESGAHQTGPRRFRAIHRRPGLDKYFEMCYNYLQNLASQAGSTDPLGKGESVGNLIPAPQPAGPPTPHPHTHNSTGPLPH
jgi:hypothetical protein